jgi:hypothetical protein
MFGFYEYRARAYHAGLGRFMSEDPQLFDAGDYNLFRYCHNDPIDFTDPMGLLTTQDLDWKRNQRQTLQVQYQQQINKLMRQINVSALQRQAMNTYRNYRESDPTRNPQPKFSAIVDPKSRLVGLNKETLEKILLGGFIARYASADAWERNLAGIINPKTHGVDLAPTMVKSNPGLGSSQQALLPPLPHGYSFYAFQVHSHTPGHPQGPSPGDIGFGNRNSSLTGVMSFTGNLSLYVPFYGGVPAGITVPVHY